jgi:hypothetical protein
MDRELLNFINKIVNNGDLLEKDRFLELSNREKVEYINIVSRYRNGRDAIIISRDGYYDADDNERIDDLTEYAENLHDYGWELFEADNNTTLNKDLLNDLLLDIKAPMQIIDLVKLMKENDLAEEAELLIRTVKKMGFDKNDTIYVDNILSYFTQDVCVYEKDGDTDYFESRVDGTYSYSYTDRISQAGLIHSDSRAQDLYIPCDDDNYLYIGIILG